MPEIIILIIYDILDGYLKIINAYTIKKVKF